MGEVRQPIDEYGVDQAVLVSEVVLHHRVIGHARFDADLSQRDTVDTVDREQTLRSEDHHLFRGRSRCADKRTRSGRHRCKKSRV